MTAQERLNLEPLERANARLGRFIARYSEVGQNDPDSDIFHAAVVKGFEYTYELAFNAIRRYVAYNVLSPGRVGQMRIPDILRAAARNGLIASVDDWFEFRERRNSTSHEYFDPESADRIVNTAPALHRAASELLETLRANLESQ